MIDYEHTKATAIKNNLNIKVTIFALLGVSHEIVKSTRSMSHVTFTHTLTIQLHTKLVPPRNLRILLATLRRHII